MIHTRILINLKASASEPREKGVTILRFIKSISNDWRNVLAVSIWIGLSFLLDRMLSDIAEFVSTILHKVTGLILAVIMGTLLWKVFR